MSEPFAERSSSLHRERLKGASGFRCGSLPGSQRATEGSERGPLKKGACRTPAKKWASVIVVVASSIYLCGLDVEVDPELHRARAPELLVALFSLLDSALAAVDEIEFDVDLFE